MDIQVTIVFLHDPFMLQLLLTDWLNILFHNFQILSRIHGSISDRTLLRCYTITLPAPCLGDGFVVLGQLAIIEWIISYALQQKMIFYSYLSVSYRWSIIGLNSKANTKNRSKCTLECLKRNNIKGNGCGLVCDLSCKQLKFVVGSQECNSYTNATKISAVKQFYKGEWAKIPLQQCGIGYS